MKNEDLITVIEAAINGECVQKKPRSLVSWMPHDGKAWATTIYDYRIKPMPREVWVSFNGNGSVCSATLSDMDVPTCGKSTLFREVLDDSTD